jgi:cell wall-associated NlpC family hydrolase
MRNMLPIGCLALALAGAAHGQTPRLHFVDLPPPDRAVLGRVTLHVSDDPITRPSHSRVVIRLDGDLIAECYRLPLDLAWETDGIADGRHLLQLVLLEDRGGKTIDRILDEHTITIRSRVKAADPKPRTDTAPSHRPETIESTLSGSDPGRGVPFAPPPTAAKPTPQPAEAPRESERKQPAVATAADLNSLNATALALAGKKLCIGLGDGSLTIFDPADGKATRVAGPPAAGEARAVAVGSKGTIWWLCAPMVAAPVAAKKGAPAMPAVVQFPQLCSYQPSDGSMQTYDVAAIGARFEPRQIVPWINRVALVAGSAGVILDPKTGQFSDLDDELPKAAIEARQQGGMLRVAGDGSTVVVAVLEQAAGATDGMSSRNLRIWRSRGGSWTGGGAQELEASAGSMVSLGLTTSTVTLLLPTGVLTTNVSRGGEGKLALIPADISAMDSRTQVVCDGVEAWWLHGSTLFHADGDKQSADALFPWNVKGMQPKALVADRGGAWVATSAGVRHVALDAPDSESGYGGFVRARLGDGASDAIGSAEQKLAGAIESWQGTPYVWGGESRKGVDCSGFVMVAFREAGIDLPHGSDNLRSYEEGQRVMDELRYGDVLVYPGHAAIYIGNGQTAETVSSGKRGVGKSTVWRRTQVVVRRFLNVVTEHTPLASRGGKPPLRKPIKKASAPARKKRT